MLSIKEQKELLERLDHYEDLLLKSYVHMSTGKEYIETLQRICETLSSQNERLIEKVVELGGSVQDV